MLPIRLPVLHHELSRCICLIIEQKFPSSELLHWDRSLRGMHRFCSGRESNPLNWCLTAHFCSPTCISPHLPRKHLDIWRVSRRLWRDACFTSAQLKQKIKDINYLSCWCFLTPFPCFCFWNEQTWHWKMLFICRLFLFFFPFHSCRRFN